MALLVRSSATPPVFGLTGCQCPRVRNDPKPAFCILEKSGSTWWEKMSRAAESQRTSTLLPRLLQSRPFAPGQVRVTATPSDDDGHHQAVLAALPRMDRWKQRRRCARRAILPSAPQGERTTSPPARRYNGRAWSDRRGSAPTGRRGSWPRLGLPCPAPVGSRRRRRS